MVSGKQAVGLDADLGEKLQPPRRARRENQFHTSGHVDFFRAARPNRLKRPSYLKR